MIYYCCRDITPIRVSISKLIFEEQQKDKNIAMKPLIFNAKSEKIKKTPKEKKNKKNKSTKDYAPPKKARVRRTNQTRNNNNSSERKKQTSNIKLIDLVKSKRKSIKNKPQKDDEDAHSEQGRKRKSLIDYQDEMVLKTREQLLNSNANEKATAILYNNNKLESKKNLNSDEKKKIQDSYDNFELNNMNYQDACDLDKRSCIRKRTLCIIYILFKK